MRIYEFVREHVMPLNAVVFTSVTVAGILDFLAPQAPYLAWLSYGLAGALVLLMALELHCQRSASSTRRAWYDRFLDLLRTPPGPLWKSPAWQVFAIVALVALVVGQASKARADSGGLIAGAAPSLRSVQALLLGLKQETQGVREAIDVMSPKVDSIHTSVGRLESALRDPRDHLAEGDYPFLRQHADAGKPLPQDKWMLLRGLNRKRDDRFDLLRLYIEKGFDIRQPVPVSMLMVGPLIDDVPTLNNFRKLNAWAHTRLQMPSEAAGYLMVDRCENINLLVYALLADDSALADWLVQQGLSAQQQFHCAFGDQRWTLTAQSIRQILSGT